MLLPPATLAPCTLIPPLILFFEAGPPTRASWVYDHPLPDALMTSTYNQPLRYAKFAAG